MSLMILTTWEKEVMVNESQILWVERDGDRSKLHFSDRPEGGNPWTLTVDQDFDEIKRRASKAKFA